MKRSGANSYETLRSGFRVERPQRFNFARDIVDRWAASDPELLAMWWVDDSGAEKRRTFADISKASQRATNVLVEAGVGRGDRVMVVLGRQIAWWEIFTACLRLGAVICPGTVQLSARDLTYRINAAGAVCIVTDTTGAQKIDTVADQCPTLRAKLVIGGERPGWIGYEHASATADHDVTAADTAADEPAICYFTSGTTGPAKMCMHGHGYALGHTATGRHWLNLTPTDLHWNMSDTGWAKAAWSSYFGPWICGAAVFVHHADGFDPAKTLAILERYPITTFCGAPTIYRMLVLQSLERFTFDTLRHCLSAGEPLNPEVMEAWYKATGITIHDGYGQTETTILCGIFPGIEPRFGSMGKPAPGIELAIVDDAGKPLTAGDEGDIAVHIHPEPPAGLFQGYHGEPEKTASSFRGDWYITGDRGCTDTDGYFWFISRADDVILSAGYRIGPFEVESALIEHPAVAESAVVSSPDEQRGEVVKAFIVLAPGHRASDALAEELQRHVKTVTAPYKYPRRIAFVDDLPKTVSGKIRRVELRNREWKRS